MLVSMNKAHPLFDLIASKKAKIGVIGLGYVGLPLVHAFFKNGFSILGFDTDDNKVRSLKEGKSYIKTFDSETIQRMVGAGQFDPTSDFSRLKEADALLICVPTPLTKNREPDMTYVEKTAESIQKTLRPGQIIILESTTYPGTLNEVIQPVLEKTRLSSNQDFFLAYSPEREDPGNNKFTTSDIPKVVGADSKLSLDLACLLYEQIVPRVIPVSSSATAEAVKLTENIFRSVNIALVNELKVVYSRMGIDIWEVIEAAKTKPFGFMPFYPGPGLGGHCIPIDPFYLTWKAREYGVATRFIELAGEVNTHMPFYVIERLRDALDQKFHKSLRGSRILVLGMAYKKNVDDIRESPSLLICDMLEAKNAHVDFYDPYVEEIHMNREHPNLAGKRRVEFSPQVIASYDAVLILTDHDSVDYSVVEKNAKLVVDSRNAIKNNPDHLVKA